MARAKSKNTQSNPGNTPKLKYRTEWLNCRLSVDDEPAILTAVENPDDLFAVLASICAQDGGFSVRFDTDKSSFSAFVFTPANPDTGLVHGISAYGKSALFALAAVLYKFDLYQSGSERVSQAGQSLGFG